MSNSRTVTLYDVRFSYLFVLEPKGYTSIVKGQETTTEKYSTSILIPNSNTEAIEKAKKGIEAALEMGYEKGKFSKKRIKFLHIPLRNGTEEFDAEQKGKEYDDHLFFNASNKNKPGVINEFGKPLTSLTEVYSGCWGNVCVTFYPFKVSQKSGIGVALEHVMITKDGDRLDGQISLDAAFGNVIRKNEENAETEETGLDSEVLDADDDMPF